MYGIMAGCTGLWDDRARHHGWNEGIHVEDLLGLLKGIGGDTFVCGRESSDKVSETSGPGEGKDTLRHDDSERRGQTATLSGCGGSLLNKSLLRTRG